MATLEMNRRGLLLGLGASLFAAPAIVRVASLMPVRQRLVEVTLPVQGGNSLLTIDMITREAFRLWRNTNKFMQQIDREYPDALLQINSPSCFR